MHEPLAQLPVGARALEARRLMDAQGIRHVAVVDGHGVAVGVVSDRDLRAAGPSRLTLRDERLRDKALSVIPLADVMSHPPTVVTAGTPLALAVRTMLRQRIGCVLVADISGRPVGILTTSDVMRVALTLVERESNVIAELAGGE